MLDGLSRFLPPRLDIAQATPRKNPDDVNLICPRADQIAGLRAAAPVDLGLRGSASEEQEVDQRNQGSADAGGDQSVIGAEVVLHVEGGLHLVCHGGGLERT